MNTLKKIKGFTLVEMLIVMGIIIILMAVGIASGRFAIRRANKIEHQNAAEQIYQAAQSYYSDNREYPVTTDGDVPPFADLMGATYLDEYIDDFDGGSEGSYGYAVDSTGQVILICVTYGGNEDTNELGVFCTGNGIGSDDLFSGDTPEKKDISFSSADQDDYNAAINVFETSCANWDPESQDWDTSSDCAPDEIASPEPV